VLSYYSLEKRKEGEKFRDRHCRRNTCVINGGDREHETFLPSTFEEREKGGEKEMVSPVFVPEPGKKGKVRPFLFRIQRRGAQTGPYRCKKTFKHCSSREKEEERKGRTFCASGEKE